MSTARTKRAFTIIEATMSIALASIGIVSALVGIAAMTKNEAAMMDSERIRRLAAEKYQEIAAIQDFTTPSGDFQDRNEGRYVWEMSTNPTSITNLSYLSVTVHPSGDSNTQDQYTLTGLVYVPPQTTTTGATGGP